MSGGRAGRQISFLMAGLLFLGYSYGNGFAGSEIRRGQGQTLYVPAYSSIYCGDKGRTFNLTTTLSVRNADPENPIRVISLQYYDSAGKPIQNYLKEPLELGPLSSRQFLVGESDLTGGIGPSFILRWESAKEVNVPVVQAVMIGCASNQGISFVCPGQVIAVEDVKP